jgi:hypothetical protein
MHGERSKHGKNLFDPAVFDKEVPARFMRRMLKMW